MHEVLIHLVSQVKRVNACAFAMSLVVASALATNAGDPCVSLVLGSLFAGIVTACWLTAHSKD